jgi:hypothetical protein
VFFVLSARLLIVSFLCFVSGSFFGLISQLCLARFGGCSACLKSINTTFGVDDLLFTSKERVRA